VAHAVSTGPTGPPRWAKNLLARVLRDAGWSPEQIAATELVWRPHNRRFGSSGRTRPTERRIAIWAGTDRQDQRLVLLHEAAHILCPPREGHGVGFWRVAWPLFQRYGVPMRYALKREAVHYTTALATAHALGIRGAADAQQATEWMVAQRRRRRAAYRVARHEEIRAYQRAYYAAHREEILARKAARRESPRGGGSTIPGPSLPALSGVPTGSR
jgi:hypothetical protein